MHQENWINNTLEPLKVQGLERNLEMFPHIGGKLYLEGQPYLNFASNDYLDLVNYPLCIEAARAALEKYGAGSAASRLVTGTLPLHNELERCLAVHKGYPAALVFGSGYMANAGTIPCLVDKNDVVFADRLVHASILDGIILSQAQLIRFKHNDLDHLETRLKRYETNKKKLIITESVFSMDGDLAPLSEIATLAQTHEAMLMVDEAHASGVFGNQGCGLVRHGHLEKIVNVSMGTLSKALGGYGGFVACSKAVKKLLTNKARAFIYTTAPPPSSLGAALGALDVLGKKPNVGKALLERASIFRKQLNDAGLNTLKSESQIIPILIGDNQRAVDLSKELRAAGLLAVAIRPPTVPPGTARLRLSITRAHTPDDLNEAAKTIIRIARKNKVI
ncbi:MAG: 8-amino-7-oxononanoate synthase [Kiritimatiellae bacterium]|nr:8-amino-7-oxononanoate synthase [Kiritimatiellia bacterium]